MGQHFVATILSIPERRISSEGKLLPVGALHIPLLIRALRQWHRVPREGMVPHPWGHPGHYEQAQLRRPPPPCRKVAAHTAALLAWQMEGFPNSLEMNGEVSPGHWGCSGSFFHLLKVFRQSPSTHSQHEATRGQHSTAAAPSHPLQPQQRLHVPSFRDCTLRFSQMEKTDLGQQGKQILHLERKGWCFLPYRGTAG